MVFGFVGQKVGDYLKLFMDLVEYMVEDEQRRTEMGKKGYKYLCENYTVEKGYEAIMKNF